MSTRRKYEKNSFNRYMVECECSNNLSISSEIHGFNRYMVECELSYYGTFEDEKDVLIDTWWNVNRPATKNHPLKPKF